MKIVGSVLLGLLFLIMSIRAGETEVKGDFDPVKFKLGRR